MTVRRCSVLLVSALTACQVVAGLSDRRDASSDSCANDRECGLNMVCTDGMCVGATSDDGGSGGRGDQGGASASDPSGPAGASSMATGGSMTNGGSAGTSTAGSGGSTGAGGSAGSTAGGIAGSEGRGGAGGVAGNGGSAGAAGAPTFQPCPASGPCRIMPFGDSITQGYNVAGGYRAPLFHLALAAKHDITFVGSANDYSVLTVDGVAFPKNHEGHGGYTIEGNNGIAQFVGTSIPNFKPNIIMLMIGTNDISGNSNVADAPNRLGKLLDSMFKQDANILVILAQLVPTASDVTNPAVNTYNAAMPNLVASRVGHGQHIVLVDMYTAFTNDSNYKQSLLGDNLDPNQTGYNLMADVWFKALNPYLR